MFRDQKRMSQKPKNKKEGLKQSTSLPGRRQGLGVLADSCVAGRQQNSVDKIHATMEKVQEKLGLWIKPFTPKIPAVFSPVDWQDTANSFSHLFTLLVPPDFQSCLWKPLIRITKLSSVKDQRIYMSCWQYVWCLSQLLSSDQVAWK